MRILIVIPMLAVLGLSGCAVAEVGSAVVGAGISVVRTGADVAGDVISAPIDVTSGSDDDKKDKN